MMDLSSSRQWGRWFLVVVVSLTAVTGFLIHTTDLLSTITFSQRQVLVGEVRIVGEELNQSGSRTQLPYSSSGTSGETGDKSVASTQSKTSELVKLLFKSPGQTGVDMSNEVASPKLIDSGQTNSKSVSSQESSSQAVLDRTKLNTGQSAIPAKVAKLADSNAPPSSQLNSKTDPKSITDTSNNPASLGQKKVDAAVQSKTTPKPVPKLSSDSVSANPVNNSWPTTEEIEASLEKNSRLYDSNTLNLMSQEYILKCRHFTIKPSDLQFVPESKSPCWMQGTRTRCLPAFYIAGFAKCATTSLFELVNKHKQVAAACEKEPNFWALTRFKPWRKPFGNYIDCFHPAKDQVTGDASPLYVWNTEFITTQADYPEQLAEPLAARTRDALLDRQILPLYLVHQYTPNAKYIISIRDPVERTYSYYNYLRYFYDKNSADGKDRVAQVKASTSPADFHRRVLEKVAIFRSCLSHADVRACAHAEGFHGASYQVEIMFYGIYIQELLRVIPRENFLFINQHQLSSSPRIVLDKVFKFLELDSDAHALDEVERHLVRANGGRGKPRPMLPATRLLLQKVYAPFNRQMARLLNDTSFLFDYS